VCGLYANLLGWSRVALELDQLAVSLTEAEGVL
jgi:hypothetical protein